MEFSVLIFRRNDFTGRAVMIAEEITAEVYDAEIQS